MELEINMKKNKGFTLIELLVALSAFSIIVLTMTASFVSVVKAQRQAFVLQNIQEASRYILESMGKEIRMSAINSSAGNGLSIINITNPDGESIDYQFASNKIQRRVDAGDWQDLNLTDSFHLTGSFYITKDTSPYRVIVTVVLKAESQGNKAEEQARIYLQNTIAPRIY